MTGETLLVAALAVVSTLAAGLAAGTSAPRAQRRPLGRARAALVVVANVIALPGLAWALTSLIDVSGAAGLVLCAAAPGGSTGPLLAVVAGGDAALAARWFIGLTVAGTASGFVVLSVLAPRGLDGLARAAIIVAAFAVVPMLSGAVIGRRWPARGAALTPWLARLGLALLLATVGVLAVRHGHTATPAALGCAAVVVSASLAIGLAGRTRAERLALAQVTAVRNLTLALLALAAIDSAPAATAAVLSYGLVMYGITGAIAVAARA